MDEGVKGAFEPDRAGLQRGLELLLAPPGTGPPLPEHLPDTGLGESGALEQLAPIVLSAAQDFSASGFLAHMDPPTPWITWAVAQWVASRNQNLLHPETAPAARALEQRVVEWLAPFFAMNGGHLTPGSTLANLTALWVARETGCTEVVATTNAHLSVEKSASILGLPLRVVGWDDPGDLRSSAVVITAGATATGEIENMHAALGAKWRHVDAAWAGPLRLSERHRLLLHGMETADSVSVSAHKWLFQPKESALVLFADTRRAHALITTGAGYLAAPNVGVLGSHGATAAPLAATLLAYGRAGVAAWIDHAMDQADELHRLVDAEPDLEARTPPQAGVVNWRHRRVATEDLSIPSEVVISTVEIDGERWLRSVAANPLADPALVVDRVVRAAC